jgi:hypothetical protein
LRIVANLVDEGGAWHYRDDTIVGRGDRGRARPVVDRRQFPEITAFGDGSVGDFPPIRREIRDFDLAARDKKQVSTFAIATEDLFAALESAPHATLCN